jgi:hypothetical protein
MQGELSGRLRVSSTALSAFEIAALKYLNDGAPLPAVALITMTTQPAGDPFSIMSRSVAPIRRRINGRRN